MSKSFPLLASLERPSSPKLPEIQQATKRVKFKEVQNEDDMELEDVGGAKLSFKYTWLAHTKQVGELASWNDGLKI